MSNQSYAFIGHGPILVGHCPMTGSYLQLWIHCLVETLKQLNAHDFTRFFVILTGKGVVDTTLQVEG